MAGNIDDFKVTSTAMTNMDNLATFNVRGVMDANTIIAALSTGESNSILTLVMLGHSDSTMTVADFAGVPSSLHITTLEFFPLMTGAINFPATLYQIAIDTNPVFNDFDSAGAPVIHILSIGGIGTGLTYGTLDLTACTTFGISADLSVTDVNNILIALDANGINNGNVGLKQVPDAVPTGAGATAAANLLGKGWTVQVDP